MEISSQIEKMRSAMMSTILPLQQQVGGEEPALVEALKKMDDMSIMVDGWKAMVSKAFERVTPKYKDILTKVEEVAEKEAIPRITNLINQLKGTAKYNTKSETPERLLMHQTTPQKESSIDGWNFGKEGAPVTQKLKEWWAMLVGWFKRDFLPDLDSAEESLQEINEYLDVMSSAPATASLNATADGSVQYGTCDCVDPGCPIHEGRNECVNPASTTVYRVDMEDSGGTDMCEHCAEDALSSGVFSTK
jgi:hypothetical protein